MLIWKKIFRILISLKLAVIVLTTLTLALTAATFIESIYDIKTGQYFVYKAFWFHALLFFLGVIIFCVALSRWPWKKRHTPFLTAHLGILILLFGSWVTQKTGVDASIIIDEGQTSTILEEDIHFLNIYDGKKNLQIPVPWRPPTIGFDPIEIKDLGIKISEYITHADTETEMREAQTTDSPKEIAPAITLKLQIPQMGFQQEFKLFSGDSSTAVRTLGPANFILLPKTKKAWSDVVPGTRLELRRGPAGELLARSVSAKGKVKLSKFSKQKVKGSIIPVSWKGPMGQIKVEVLDWLPDAFRKTTYFPSRTQYGDSAPWPAIKLEHASGSRWLSLGERVDFAGKSVFFSRKQLMLPFGIFLKKFQIDYHQGTRNPAEFSSLVKVEGKDILISMNEPLTHKGYTFYQSSYVPGEPRPTTTILSVNRDPGRWLKYLGSLLIVLGSIMLFAAKYLKRGSASRRISP